MNMGFREECEMIFAYNVRFLRNKHSLTKKEMSEILGISEVALQQIEKGDIPKKVSITSIFKMQEYFEISAKRIMGERLM